MFLETVNFFLGGSTFDLRSSYRESAKRIRDHLGTIGVDIEIQNSTTDAHPSQIGRAALVGVNI